MTLNELLEVTKKQWALMKFQDLKWAEREAEIKFDLAPETSPMRHPDKKEASKELAFAREAIRVFMMENFEEDHE